MVIEVTMRRITKLFTAHFAVLVLEFAVNNIYNHLELCGDYYVDS